MAETLSTLIAQPFSLSASLAATVIDSGTVTTIAAGSDGAVLPQATINVASTTGFATSGTIYVVSASGVQTVAYTGVTGTSFTTCTGGVGAMSTGGAVTAWRVVAFNPSGTVWYRTYCAPTSGAGATSADPKEWIAYADGIISGSPNLWSFALNASGKVVATYSGTGTGTVTFTSTIPRTLLGFTANISIAGPGTQTAVNSPTHCIFSHWREGAQSWQSSPAGMAISEMDDGTVDVLGGTYQKITRAFGLRGHPRTPTDATALGMIVTAAFPDEVLVNPTWLAPTATPASAALPWSIHQFLATSKGKELGYTLGQFQELIAGSETYFDEGYWTAKTLTSQSMVTVPGWEQLVDTTSLELTRTNRLVRT